MSQILYPDQRLPRTKDFLKEHVIQIRKTVQDNRQKQLEVRQTLYFPITGRIKRTN